MTLDADRIRDAVATERLGTAVEHYPVAVSTESLALGWLRQRGGGHGSLVVADSEISARGRRNADWSNPGGLAASVIVEPALPVDRQDLLWAHALLAARDTLHEAGRRVETWWPEGLLLGDEVVGLVRVESQLAPGTVASAVLTFRLQVADPGGDDERLRLLAGILRALDPALDRPPQEVADAYRDVDPLTGSAVAVDLLPTGSVRGMATSIDGLGAFGVEGSSGHITRLPVDQIRQISRVGD